MTAEVVVMNREGVALAADSAVTIGPSQKVFNTANKVFMLCPGSPIGILVYNNPAFMDVPWEILIKAYRTKVVDEEVIFEHLHEYGEDFLNFIEANGDEYVTDRQLTEIFGNLIHILLDKITKEIVESISAMLFERSEFSEEEVDKIVDSTIKLNHGRWKEKENIFPKEKDQAFRQNLKEKYQDIIDEKINSLFDKLPVSGIRKRRLREICLYKFSKKEGIRNFSGIVFTGYGSKDLFPSCVEYLIGGYFCDTLIFEKNRDVRIGFESNEGIAGIIAFAQDDVVENILNGCHPLFLNELRKNLLSNLTPEEIENVLSSTQTSVNQKYTSSIMNTIDILPKDELAMVAQTLVSLTSFMRRVSMDLETVGGPIDVAVISKKDGFIWIDRKHYFDLDKNLHFNYSN